MHDKTTEAVLHRLSIRSTDALALASAVGALVSALPPTSSTQTISNTVSALKRRVEYLTRELVKLKYTNPNFNAEKFREKFAAQVAEDIADGSLLPTNLRRIFTYPYFKTVANPYIRMSMCQTLVDFSTKYEVEPLELWLDFIDNEGVDTEAIATKYLQSADYDENLD